MTFQQFELMRLIVPRRRKLQKKDELESTKQQTKVQSAPIANKQTTTTTTKRTTQSAQNQQEEQPFTVVGGNRHKTATPPVQQQQQANKSVRIESIVF